MSMKDHLPGASAAVVVGATQFVPLPFVDDWIASFSRRQLVKNILAKHGRTFPLQDLGALTDDGSWWGLPWRMAKNLALFPVKKLLRPFAPILLARAVALAVGRTLALAHTLDRQLAFGRLRDDDDAVSRRDQARQLRKALDQAWAKIDQRLITRTVKSIALALQRKTPVEGEMEGLLAELDRRVDLVLAGLPLQ